MWRKPRFERLNRPWERVGGRRRLLLALLVAVPTAVATPIMGSVLPHQGSTPLEAAMIVVFAALFAWISIGFWTAMLGFVVLLRGTDGLAVTRRRDTDAPVREDARTAILFPVCNEDMNRVAPGIEATWRSLMDSPRAASFDVFILSDSGDPDNWVNEEAAWADLCDRLGAHGRIFYRRRRVNLKRKSGNIADFCRRFGQRYTYMAVMDADSVMNGMTLSRMVGIMERRRSIGILQTAPAIFGRETLIARTQQFAGKAYGPMFAAGLHYWQLGDAQFWGHNALIRVRPFMRHCSLPRLPGKPPLGGDILSHDFVEAALMRRAGYGVWLAYDLAGSYEEPPPTLLAELKRDRRWCQGNLQHMRLLFTRGLFPLHRALFLNGAMAYVSALLWFIFLLLSSAEAILESLLVPAYFPPTRTLFPQWPVWEPKWAVILLASTGVVLFLPKLAAYFLHVVKGRARDFGGVIPLGLSILCEVIVSTLLAPIRMLFHSKFVFVTLLGWQISWGTQQRDDSSTPVLEAVRFHGLATLTAIVWGGALFLVNRSFFWWLTPIVASLALSIPISIFTSRADVGRLLRRLRIFCTPEELDPPRELRLLVDALHAREAEASAPPPPGRYGFKRAVLDPWLNRLHVALLGGKPRSFAPEVAARRDALLAKAAQAGPGNLSRREKLELLYDPGRLARLHESVRAAAPAERARWE